MTLLRLGWVSLALGAALGCSRAAAPPLRVEPPRSLLAPSRSALLASAPGYVTITPEVSVSRNARPFEPMRASVDEHADVMAEILALPPGQ